MWETLESDPALFNELVERLGAQNVAVTEMVDLSPEAFASIPDVYGVIFLYKYRRQQAVNAPRNGQYAPDAPLYFAKQVINNACATQAVLGVILNADGVELAPHLVEFREFTAEFDPETKGEAIAGSDSIREAHNHMARPSAFFDDDPESPTNEDDDGLYHYVSYVPHNGHVYEIDGLRPYPIDHGAIGNVNETISEILQRRVQQHATSELRFSILTLSRESDFAPVDRAGVHRQNALRRQQYTGFAIELIKQIARKSSRAEWASIIEQGRIPNAANAGQSS